MNPPRGRVLPSLLSVPALVYGGVVRLRNKLYDRGRGGRRAGLPVISVGNITVGGTGKTPMVAWLARHLGDGGLRPAVVSRGYGGTAGRGPLVVSVGQGPLCAARECGDEPYQLALSLRGVVVVVGADRWAAAVSAREHGAQAAILDDGFQHRGLARNLDIVLLDAGNPFGNGRLLPAGSLREPLSGLERADVVLISRSRPEDPAHAAIESVVRRHNSAAPIVLTGHRTVGFVDRSGLPVQAPLRVVGFCGIGNPELFRADLQSQAVEIVDFRAYRDHHRYTAGEIAGLRSRAAEERATLVTTEKDLARLSDAPLDLGSGMLALRIEARIFEPEPLVRAVDVALERTPR